MCWCSSNYCWSIIRPSHWIAVFFLQFWFISICWFFSPCNFSSICDDIGTSNLEVCHITTCILQSLGLFRQCRPMHTHTQSSLFPVLPCVDAACARMRSAEIHIQCTPGHLRSVSSFHNFCVQSWAYHFAKLVTATLSQTPHCDRTTMQNRQTCYAVRTPATISATAAPTTSPTEPPHAPNLVRFVRHSILRMRYRFASSYHQPYWSPVPLIPCFIDLLSHWSPVRYVCIIYI